MYKQKKLKQQISIFLLIAAHIAGFVGLTTESFHDLFIRLVPFNLLLTGFVCFINHNDYSTKFTIWARSIVLAGIGVEILGVQTGVIFGEYYYSHVLGWHVFDVPVLIGLNWLLLIYSIGVITHRLPVGSLFVKSVVGAAMMTGLDVLIEPVAVHLNFWQWVGETIPTQNFIAWFVISFFMLLSFHYLPFNKRNIIGYIIYPVQCIFFMAIILKEGL